VHDFLREVAVRLPVRSQIPAFGRSRIVKGATGSGLFCYHLNSASGSATISTANVGSLCDIKVAISVTMAAKRKHKRPALTEAGRRALELLKVTAVCIGVPIQVGRRPAVADSP